MWVKLSFFIVAFFIMPVWADDCIDYKLNPKVNLDSPDWSMQVVQPLESLSVLHGNVIATLVDNYDIVADVTSIEDGFCVALKSVDATVGYSDFLVQVDVSHRPDSCSYNAIVAHEDIHIRAYLSIIDDFSDDLRQSVYVASDSIMPIFVSNAQDIDSGVDKLNQELQNHPQLILIKQKIKAAEEIRNKRVDLNNDETALKKCFD